MPARDAEGFGDAFKIVKNDLVAREIGLAVNNDGVIFSNKTESLYSTSSDNLKVRAGPLSRQAISNSFGIEISKVATRLSEITPETIFLDTYNTKNINLIAVTCNNPNIQLQMLAECGSNFRQFAIVLSQNQSLHEKTIDKIVEMVSQFTTKAQQVWFLENILQTRNPNPKLLEKLFLDFFQKISVAGVINLFDPNSLPHSLEMIMTQENLSSGVLNILIEKLLSLLSENLVQQNFIVILETINKLLDHKNCSDQTLQRVAEILPFQRVTHNYTENGKNKVLNFEPMRTFSKILKHPSVTKSTVDFIVNRYFSCTQEEQVRCLRDGLLEGLIHNALVEDNIFESITGYLPKNGTLSPSILDLDPKKVISEKKFPLKIQLKLFKSTLESTISQKNGWKSLVEILQIPDVCDEILETAFTRILQLTDDKFEGWLENLSLSIPGVYIKKDLTVSSVKSGKTLAKLTKPIEIERFFADRLRSPSNPMADKLVHLPVEQPNPDDFAGRVFLELEEWCTEKIDFPIMFYPNVDKSRTIFSKDIIIKLTELIGTDRSLNAYPDEKSEWGILNILQRQDVFESFVGETQIVSQYLSNFYEKLTTFQPFDNVLDDDPIALILSSPFCSAELLERASIELVDKSLNHDEEFAIANTLTNNPLLSEKGLANILKWLTKFFKNVLENDKYYGDQVAPLLHTCLSHPNASAHLLSDLYHGSETNLKEGQITHAQAIIIDCFLRSILNFTQRNTFNKLNKFSPVVPEIEDFGVEIYNKVPFTAHQDIQDQCSANNVDIYLYLRSLTLPTSPANQEYFDRFGSPTEPVSKYFGVERFFPEIANFMEIVSPQKSIQNLRRSNSEKSSFPNKTKGGVLAFMDAFATEDTPAGFLSINSAPSIINIIARLQQYVLEIPKGRLAFLFKRDAKDMLTLYQQDIAQIISGVEIYFAESSILGSNSNPNSNSPSSLNLKSSINSGELIFEVRINPKQEKSWERFLQEIKNGGKEKKDKKNGKDKKYNDDTNTGWEIFSKVEKGVYRLTIPAGDSTDSLIATETLKVLRNALEPILKTLTNEKLDPAVSILESIQAGDQQGYLDALNALDQYQEEYKEKLLQDIQENGSEIALSQEELAEFGENFIPSFTNTDQVDQELTARFEQRLNQANTTNLKIDLEKFTDTYINLEKELRTELSTKIPLKRWRQITPHLKESFNQILKMKEDIENPNISEADKTKKIKRQIQQAINQNTKLDNLYKRVFSKYEKEGDKQTQLQTNTQTQTEILILEAYQRSVTIQSAINEILSFYKPEFILSSKVLKGGTLQTTELPQEFLVDLNQGKEQGKEKGLLSTLSALARLKAAPKDIDQSSDKNQSQTKVKNQQEVITKTLETPGILLFLEKAREGYIALLKSKYTPEHIYQEILAKYSQNLVLSSLLAGVGTDSK